MSSVINHIFSAEVLSDFRQGHIRIRVFWLNSSYLARNMKLYIKNIRVYLFYNLFIMVEDNKVQFGFV